MHAKQILEKKTKKKKTPECVYVMCFLSLNFQKQWLKPETGWGFIYPPILQNMVVRPFPLSFALKQYGYQTETLSNPLS